MKDLLIVFYFEEIFQNEYAEPSGGAGIPPGPPVEFGVAVPPDELTLPQESSLNSETLHSETPIATLPEDRRQQDPVLNDAPPSTTENPLPGVKEEVGVAPLPEERKSDKASRDASTRLLRGIPSTKVQDRDFFQTPLATGPASVSPLPAVSEENTAASSTYASHPIIPNTTARTYPLASDGFKFKGVPLSKGFQQELEQEQSSPTENSIDERRNLEQSPSDVATAGHGAEAAAVTGHGSHAEHETVRKRLGFMNKLKEEMKGIPGKLHIRREKDFVGVA